MWRRQRQEEDGQQGVGGEERKEGLYQWPERRFQAEGTGAKVVGEGQP